jgi:hypothetical protein
MNTAELKQRLEKAKAKLEELQPAEEPPMLIIKFCSDVNPNAPPGTTATEDLNDEDDGLPDTFAMVPLGNHQPIPEGMVTFEQWRLMSNKNIKGDKRGN